MRDVGLSGTSQGLAFHKSSIASLNSRMAAMRSKNKGGEVSERKQVGDASSMINEEPNVVRPGGASQWLE